MAQVKNPTYFGKRLKRNSTEGWRKRYRNDLAEVERYFASSEEDVDEWEAFNLDGDLKSLYDDTVVSRESAQDALDQLQAQTIKAFQKLGEKLGYDVED